MATMHPDNHQHDHSREADELLEEFRGLFQRARRGASDALRIHRDRQAALERARREQRASRRATVDDTQRETARREERRESSSTKAKVRVTETNNGISPDLIARWAAAHAVADQFREEAAEADAHARESKDSASAARSANSSRDAETADAWAAAWDERVRAAGVDPDALAAERDTTANHEPQVDDATDRGVNADYDTSVDPDGQAFIDDVTDRAAEMAMRAADTLDTSPSTDDTRSAAELIDDTHPPEGATLTPSASSAERGIDTGADLGPSVDLDAGVSA